MTATAVPSRLPLRGLLGNRRRWTPERHRSGWERARRWRLGFYDYHWPRWTDLGWEAWQPAVSVITPWFGFNLIWAMRYPNGTKLGEGVRVPVVYFGKRG